MGDLDSVPELGSSPGEGNGNPLQYYCLENPVDRGAWPWGYKESNTTERLAAPESMTNKRLQQGAQNS